MIVSTIATRFQVVKMVSETGSGSPRYSATKESGVAAASGADPE